MRGVRRYPWLSEECMDKFKMVKAHARLRHIVIIAFALITLLGALFIWVFDHSLEYAESFRKPRSELSPATLRIALLALTLIMTVTLIGFGGYLANISIRTLKLAQFPPPGLRVIKDTQVVIGKPARIRGAVGVILSILLIISGVFFLIIVWWSVNVLLPAPSQEPIT